MKAWITKYALTGGIFTLTGEIGEDSPGMLVVAQPGALSKYYHANEWHASHQGAIAEAERMRDRKIASLKKQIAKLEALKFDE